MRITLFALVLLSCLKAPAQNVNASLEKAWKQFMSGDQLRHAMASLHVVDARTGAVVFSKNAQTGLAPASTQKIITSITALDILGSKFRYETNVGYMGSISGGTLNGVIYTAGSGDPTFGSWRWDQTGMKRIYENIGVSLKKMGVSRIRGSFLKSIVPFESNAIPDGWIWQDIGNYYGAGSGDLIWHENQYDLFLRSGREIGDPVEVAGTQPRLYAGTIFSELKSAAKGTGDNAYIYLPVGSRTAIVRGTIPVNEQRFKISGAMHDPAFEYLEGLKAFLVADKIEIDTMSGLPDAFPQEPKSFYTHYSPTLDSIVYWFNRKSINLYGEALVRTLGRERKGWGATDTGVKVIREHWKTKGIDEDELNMRDGSGLSPLNRVTTHAQVSILQYAKTREWYPDFYHSLPEYNGMRMKSGTISNVKGFCGYHTAEDGTEYIFSFLVNNYNGRASALVAKMYSVLDNLK